MQTAYPLPQTPATVSRWARMARLFSPPCVVGTPVQNPYGATISGLTVTIGRGSTGVAEAWVRTFFHVLDTADWSVTVPPNTAGNLRVDRILLRWDPTVEDVFLVHVEGTPAANPVAQPLTQTDTGVWELPLWRFTVPANSGAPLTGLVDDRVYRDPDNPGIPVSALLPSGVTLSQVTPSGAGSSSLCYVNFPDPGVPYYVAAAVSAQASCDSGGSGLTLRLRVGSGGGNTQPIRQSFGLRIGQPFQQWAQMEQAYGPFTGATVAQVECVQETTTGSNTNMTYMNGHMTYRVIPAA